MAVIMLFAAQSASGQNLPMKLQDGFDYTLRVLGYAISQNPEKSYLNPSNILGLANHQFELDLRPDFSLDTGPVYLGLKPRMDASIRNWSEGLQNDQTDSDAEFYIQEWQTKYRPFDQFCVSYGRENLQWGPSFLLSPSNPFNAENGRNNPKKEVASSDYGKAVWTPNSTWTASFIANTAEGRLERGDDFKPAYALKTDCTTEGKSFSLIVSKQGSEDPVAGLFGSWNTTDSTILYCEARTGKGDNEIIVGNSITMQNGGILVLEYFHNSDGNSHDPAILLVPPFHEIDQHDIFLRKNYFLVQYSQPNMAKSLDLTLRWTINLDDSSCLLTGLTEYEIGDHAKLFALGLLTAGGENDEFGNILNNSVMAGIDYIF